MNTAQCDFRRGLALMLRRSRFDRLLPQRRLTYDEAHPSLCTGRAVNSSGMHMAFKTAIRSDGEQCKSQFKLMNDKDAYLR